MSIVKFKVYLLEYAANKKYFWRIYNNTEFYKQQSGKVYFWEARDSSADLPIIIWALGKLKQDDHPGLQSETLSENKQQLKLTLSNLFKFTIHL